MTQERWKDERMIEWLEAGPSDLPVEPLEAAVAYARAHPRGRLSWVGLRRVVMDRIHLTEVEPRAEHRWSFAAVGAVTVIAVAVVALVGGAGLLRAPGTAPGGALGPSSPLASSPPGTASPAPTPEPTPLPTAPVAVTGTQSCQTANSGTTSMAGDVTQYRGVALSCSGAMSDPRLDGGVTVNLSIDERADGSADIWGTATLANAGGSWTGMWRGTVDVGYTTQHVEGVYLGSGANEGLRFRFSQVTSGDAYALTGTIDRIASVPPDGTVAVVGSECSTTSTGTQANNGDVLEIRGVVLACAGPASDPRLTGAMTVTVDIDERSDESADMRGTATIQSVAGGWTGDWTGSVAAGYTTHRMEGVLIGSGAFAGLEFRFTQIGLDTAGYVMTGTISPAP